LCRWTGWRRECWPECGGEPGKSILTRRRGKRGVKPTCARDTVGRSPLVGVGRVLTRQRPVGLKPDLQVTCRRCARDTVGRSPLVRVGRVLTRQRPVGLKPDLQVTCRRCARDTVGRSPLVRERAQCTSSRKRLASPVTCRRCARDTVGQSPLVGVGRVLTRQRPVGLKPDLQVTCRRCARDTVGRSPLVRERAHRTSSRKRLASPVTCRRCGFKEYALH